MILGYIYAVGRRDAFDTDDNDDNDFASGTQDDGEDDGHGEACTKLLYISLPFAILASLLTFWTMAGHWLHYYQPHRQRYIVRVIFMVPVYCVTSILSLAFPSASHYLSLIRDIYEAFTVFTFFELLVALMNGEREIIAVLSEKAIVRHCCNCCQKLTRANHPEVYYFRLKRMCLQFVVIMPLLAATAVFMEIFEAPQKYHWYLEGLRTISIFTSIWALINFYLALREELSPYNPAAKWICLKAVVFLSFFQGLGIAIGYAVAQPDTPFGPEDLQNCIICCELLLAAMAHVLVYNYKEFDGGDGMAARLALKTSVKDSLLPGDFIADTYSTIKRPHLPKSSPDDLSHVDFGEVDEDNDDFSGYVRHEQNFPIVPKKNLK